MKANIPEQRLSDIEKEIFLGVYYGITGCTVHDAVDNYTMEEWVDYLFKELYGKDFMKEKILLKILVKNGVLDE